MRPVLLLLCIFSLTGCLTPSARDLVTKEGAEGRLMTQYFDTSTFVLFGLLRPALTRNAPLTAEAEANDVLHVYIEGDGLAWVTRSRPSHDPTPTKPVGLLLAMADPADAPVLYLARPCQYVTGHRTRLCDPKYWTSARLSREVLQSLDEAISEAKKRVKSNKVALVGYSGGGSAAVLLAAQRDDVVFLGTVADNLDHTAWTALHKVSPLRESLNPLDVAEKVTHMRQRHMSSAADTVVPPFLSQAFCQALRAEKACVTVTDVKHGGDWQKVWSFDYNDAAAL